MVCQASTCQLGVLWKRKKYRLFVQSVKGHTPRDEPRPHFFAIYEADKGYPKGFVCNLPKIVEGFDECKKPMVSMLFPENLPKFAEELLVDAFHRYGKSTEIQKEILQRLTLIRRKKSANTKMCLTS